MNRPSTNDGTPVLTSADQLLMCGRCAATNPLLCALCSASPLCDICRPSDSNLDGCETPLSFDATVIGPVWDTLLCALRPEALEHPW